VLDGVDERAVPVAGLAKVARALNLKSQWAIQKVPTISGVDILITFFEIFTNSSPNQRYWRIG
jgi:hypothetical protein